MHEKMPFEGKGRREFGLRDLGEDEGDCELIFEAEKKGDQVYIKFVNSEPPHLLHPVLPTQPPSTTTTPP